MAGMTVQKGDFKTEMTPIYNQETGQSGYVSSYHLDRTNRGIPVEHLIVRGIDGKKIGYFGENWTTDVPTNDVETEEEAVRDLTDLDGNVLKFGGEVPKDPINIRSIGTSYIGGPTQRDYGKKSGFEEIRDRLEEGVDKAKSTYDGMSKEGQIGTGILAIAAGAYGAGKLDEFLKNRVAREALMKRLGIVDASKIKGSFESLMDQMPEAFKGHNLKPSDVSIKDNFFDYSHMGGGPKFSGSGPFGAFPSEPFKGPNFKPNPLDYDHMGGGPKFSGSGPFGAFPSEPFKGSGAKIKGKVGLAIELLKQMMGR